MSSVFGEQDSSQGIKIERAGFALGATITGVNLAVPLGEEALSLIRDAWTRYLLLVFPGQQLTAQQLIDFSRLFGELDTYETQPFNRHPEFDEIMLLSNRPVDGKIPPASGSGQNWHTDLSYTTRPAKSTTLYCVEKPSVGGDTMFASMYAAYEALSPKFREYLDGLEAVHDAGLINTKRAPELVAEFKRRNPPVIHPAVRVHPESGRKALYVNDRVRQFVGMTEAESKPIIRFLCEHSITPRFVFRHRWSVNDVVMWDNRCLTHLAVGDFDPNEVRHMLRTSCMGDHYGRFESESVGPAASGSGASQDIETAVASLHD